MARAKGATAADQAAHLFFDGVVTPEVIAGINNGACCQRCGTKLRTLYHEERLYSVRCTTCEIVTLVKAGNPFAAEAKVAGAEG